MTAYSIKDVKNDLSFLLVLTGTFEADDAGFWVDQTTKERFQYQIDDSEKPKEIVSFQDPLPKGDYLYFNPFSEGFGRKAPADQLFYRAIRVALNSNVRMVVETIAEELLRSKNDDSVEVPADYLRMASVPVEKKVKILDVIDEKAIDEIKKMFDRCNTDFIHLPYHHASMVAKVNCDVFTDPQWDAKYAEGIRKKTLGAFKALILGVLGIKDASEFETFNTKYDPATKSSPRLDATLNLVLKLYSKFNEVLNENFEIDLGRLTEVIERLPLAYAIAKHQIQPTLTKLRPTDTASADTRKVAIPTTASGARRFDLAQPEDRGNAFRSGPVNHAEQYGRFKPVVLSEAPSDPLSPIPQMGGGMFAPASPFMSGGNAFHAPQSSMFSSGGTFGSGMGLNLNTPSNFGRPEVTPRYFGG